MNQPSQVFDIVFLNPGLKDFASIVCKINEGLKITIVIENDFFRDDLFYTTQFYPLSIFALKQKLEQYKIAEKLVVLAPHLFRSKKVFYPGYSSFDRFRSSIADFFYKNKDQRRSHLITHGLKSIFSDLKRSVSEGVYFQEYTFNVSRFYIEMLKYFCENGVEVYVNKSVRVEEKHLIFDDTKKKISTEILVHGTREKKTVYELPFNVTPGFSMFASHLLGRFSFSENKGTLLVIPIDDKEYSKNELRLITEDYFNLDLDNFDIKEKQQLFFSFNQVSSLLSLLNQRLPCTFEDYGFGDMFELCREKFDLAKQSGIDFPEFQTLFYRYGRGIDEMTEMAYQKVNEQSNLESVWKDVEVDFQKKYEWKN